MSSLTKEKPENHTGFKTDRGFNLNTEIALISFHNIKYSDYMEMLLIFIEYFQLITQIILLASETSLKEKVDSENSLIQGIFFCCQIFNPFFSLSNNYHVDSSLFIIFFTAAICYLIFKYILFLYIVGKVLCKFRTYDLLVYIWRWMFKTQVRVLYFIFSSFWVATTRASSKENFNIYGIENRSIIIGISISMIMIEYSSSFYLLVRYCYVLPTKNFLAEKDNYTQMITLTQKLILQLLQIVLSNNSPLNPWVFSGVCLLGDVIRNYYHFTMLPLYKIKALFYQTTLLMLLASLNISWVMQISFGLNSNSEVQEFIWITWVFLAILSVKAGRAYLKGFLRDVIISDKKYPPKLLIHKIILIKQIRKIKTPPVQYNDDHSFLYLINQTVNSKIKAVLNINSHFLEDIVLDINLKDSANKMFLHYLETLNIIFPKSSLVKLYMAYISTKKFKLYAKALKMIGELKKSRWKLISLNISLLVVDIQNIIRSRYEDQNSRIDLYVFVQSQSCFAGLKQKIAKQVELKMQLYQEITSNSPRLVQINKLSQKVYKYQCEAAKEIRKMQEIIPDNFIEPLAFLAHYYLIINHSLSEALEYQKLYFRKYEKYKKLFDSEILCQENAYQNQNAFLLISIEKSDPGKILFCTKSIESIYGRDMRSLIGRNANLLAVPVLQSLSLQMFNSFVANENESDLNKIVRFFGWHHEGYAVEVDFYVNIHPFINGHFCLAVLARKPPTNRDLLVVNQNGDIEGATKNIQEKLGIRSFEQTSNRKVNIKLLSEELSTANKAFHRVTLMNKTNAKDNNNNNKLAKSSNIALERFVLKLEKSDILSEKQEESSFSPQTAKDLYSLFKTEGKELELKCIENKSIHLYRCKLLDAIPESLNQRIITLETVHDDEVEKIESPKTPKKEVGLRTDLDLLKLEDPDESCYIASPKHVRAEKLPEFKGFETVYNNTLEKVNTEIHKNVYSSTREKMHTEASNLLSPTGRFKGFINNKGLLKSQDQINDFPVSSQAIKDGIEKNQLEASSQKEAPNNEDSFSCNSFSKDDKQLKLDNAFKAAISVRSDPRCFKLACFMFYLILVGVFAVQLYIKETWADTIHDLKVKKDIMNNAYLRSYFVVDIPVYYAIIMGMSNGKFDFSSLNTTVEDMFFYLESELVTLNKINNVLSSDINSLNEETRKTLFNKDVRIFELCSNCTKRPFITVDNFQATSSVVEFVLRLNPLVKENLTEATEQIDLFYENTLNDLTLKVGEIADIFLASLDEQRKTILLFVDLYLIVAINLLVVNCILMSLNIWSNYMTESQNMLAIAKLNTTGVNKVFLSLKNFKQMIDDQTDFEKTLFYCIKNKSLTGKETYSKAKVKKDQLKTPTAIGLSRKYYFYVLRMVVLMLIVCGLAYWSTKSTRIFIDNISQKQYQLDLINLIRSRVDLIGHAIDDLASSGINRNIENTPILTFLSKSINQIVELKSRILSAFSPENVEKGSEIQKILYEDACQIIASKYISYCQNVKDHGILPSYIQVLNGFENFLKDFYNKVSVLNTSELVAFRVDTDSFNLFFSIYYLATEGESFYLVKKIDESYENILEGSKDERNIIFGVFATILLASMITFWSFALKDLKEVNNRFRKVLQMFPPYLILSNFFLKSFLIKSSKGVLDFVKNEI